MSMDHCEPDQGKLEVQSERRSAARVERGFTMFDNYFLDKVMRKAGGVEWKVICTVIRETFGWQRDEADIPIERFIEMTGAKRSRLFEAITAACKRGVIRRPTQRSFRFQPIRKGNLHEVPKAERRRRNQEPLPFAESENRTLDHSPIIGFGESENRTLDGAVLRSGNKEVLNTHTRESSSAGNAAAQSGVCVDQQIDRQRYKAYARAHIRIDDPNAWATTAERTRQWDVDVLEWERESEERRVEFERTRALELEMQERELAAWRDRQRQAVQQSTSDDAGADSSSDITLATVEAAEQTEARELREAADREALERAYELCPWLKEKAG